MSQIVVECGVDQESRPMLAVFACNLPSAKDSNMSELLDLILAKLREYVENDYILVFFNSPIVNKPSLLWMIKAYRSLNRSYRKNLKRLIVVHPTFWARLLMDSMKSFISPKVNNVTSISR